MAEYNKDELHAPSWLNEEFLKDVLVECESDKSVKITKLTITPGSGKGDHYASVMFRIVVNYDTSKSKGQSKSMIIKTMPETDGPKKDLIGDSFIFETEISMYSKTIPAFEAELRKIGDDTILGAKMLYQSLGERKCIIFEDIVPKGYAVLKDRDVNLAEAKAAFLKLAKWHAVSYKLATEGDKSVTKYKDSFLNMKGIAEMPFMLDGVKYFLKILEKDDELKKYAPKFEAIKEDLLRDSIKFATTGNLPGVYVLCHGDFHCKNLMFKWNDKEELEDVMLLDFQMCYYAPAVLDIVYGLSMLCNDKLRSDNRDELIYYYSSNFIDTLKKLKFEGDIPKISDFQIDLLRYSHWELLLFTTYIPSWYKFAAGDSDLDELFRSSELRAKLYENPRYVAEVKQILPLFFNRGYLN